MGDNAQCTRCGKVLIDEEYDSHDCFPKIKNRKIIKFAKHHVVTKQNGEIIIDIWAFDGTNYMFEEVPENKEYTKIPYQTPNLNRKKFDDETPTGEQKLIDTSVKLLRFAID